MPTVKLLTGGNLEGKNAKQLDVAFLNKNYLKLNVWQF